MNHDKPTKKKVISLIKRNQGDIRAFGVRKLGLFGSFARGQQNEKSDVDFLVEFEQGKKSFDNFIQLSFLLEEILKRRVELVTPESISTSIRSHIDKEVEYVDISA